MTRADFTAGVGAEKTPHREFGIDLGISMLMAENERTLLVWNSFMKNPEAQTAMQLVRF